MERLEIELDPQTATWLRRRGTQRGGSLAAAAAAQLRADALADASRSMAVWYADRPGYVEDALTETAEALTEPS
ncbi:MAG TPA: hypothetical protein VFQ48_08810 [Pseudonocardiaceae bacterium]|nr:hypothetical protein [Pseudonocardiaceae bacterium]